jgi:cell filamentation protein, protein adenylyltransferase
VRRGLTGRYQVKAGAEPVRAFIPLPLPPDPPLAMSGPVQVKLERAHLALGRLDSIANVVPDTSLFLYTYVRKEALLSSQIEGTQSSLSELLLFEIEPASGAPVADVVDVSNYVAAMDLGLQRLREGVPLSNRLIREIHASLLARGRGSDKEPGEFRRSQNWIGGARPGVAHFVPPPPDLVVGCMSDLEKFLHRKDAGLPALLRAALAHVQFETIHPFLDGNGRVGRLLITFLLCHAGILREPLLCLSLHFKEHRSEYYRLLDLVRQEGDWEAWVDFFLEGIAVTADVAVATARRLGALFEEDRARIKETGRKAGSTWRVHDALKSRPILGIADAATRTGLSFPTVASALETLLKMGVAREITGRQRNRLFAYDRYLEILNEGTEPI